MSNNKRTHSNTISGGRPPALDIALTRPSVVRRNSEGSPGLPPPICVSEPTPIEPSSHAEDFISANKPVVEAIANQSDIQQQPVTMPNTTTTPANPITANGLIVQEPSTMPKKKSRSRASSVTSNIINEIKENSTIQSIANKIKPKHSTDTKTQERTSLDNTSSIAASLSSIKNISLATSKRNADFHALFRSIPEDDNLVEDFGCALQKEILLQGRIYISETHICFNANIFGWVTNLVIAFADITNIEKKTTAYFIPNAIQISTDSAKHFFASFLSRDQAFELMLNIWHLTRPDLFPPTEESSSQLTNQTTSQEDSDASSEGSGSYYDSDTEEGDSFTSESETDTENLDQNIPTTEENVKDGVNKNRKVSLASLPIKKDTKNIDAARRRAISEIPQPTYKFENDAKLPNINHGSNENKNETTKNKSPIEGIESDKKEEVTKQAYDKTECECSNKGEHFPNVVMDQVYDSTIENMYKLMFINDFMKNFLVENQKSQDLVMGEWKKGEGDIKSTRELTYIKPLYGSIGPKSTKCYITQDVLYQDFQKFVSVMVTTLTPDVPSGSSFSCKTRTCLTWAGKGKVRVLVTVLVDFTKSSWLKSTIEKASIDGQQTYYKDLDAALRAHLKEHSNDPEKRSNGKRHKKRRRHKTSRHLSSTELGHKQDNTHESIVHQLLGMVSNKLADNVTSIIDTLSSPRAAHFILFCLLIMVCINIYVARKMAFVEQRLNELSRSTIGLNKNHGLVEHVSKASPHHQEEEDLWAWLGRIDPDNERVEHVKIPIVKDSKEQEAIWDDAIKISKTAKEKLDKHMTELNKMIQRAESNLEDVTRVVNEQRQKIRQN
ncbi:uncharacterized protein BX663DRAFT_550017 [Cokeromyces recurvatus]|uniref:uncharacterized protein n=1 Tax=Cokeromyces recurvatus TaxID=90255 RepID=UPI00221FA0EC|nr:uncharacterized protein BX663DRAFT_550017 [Cokeromyces recurvatus]KAI7905189.1 hypothetical protein BX663DRAFT_550017 [Cokeromyces recurvatus]